MTDEREPPLDEETDAALRDAYAFAPAAAEEAAARFRLPAPRAPRWPWFALPAAAAAGLLIGVLGRRPAVEIREVAVPDPAPVVGFVAQCTGPVTDGAGGARGAGRPVYASDPVVAMAADARGSVILSDGTEVRLDRGARVVLKPRRVDLLAGRVWSRVVPGEPFLFEAEEARVTVTGTELSLRRDPEATRVQLFSGSATVEGAGASRELLAGQEVELADGTLSPVRRIWSEAVATGWMVELMAKSGTRDRDLAVHVDRLLEELGRTKISHLEEGDIVRDLSESCRIPVARFLVSEGAAAEPEARRKAARVLRSIADPSVAAEVARALRDPDAEVRVAAAETFKRLSKGTVCGEPEEFRSSCDLGSAAAADAWVAKERGTEPPPK
jgi:hypothetical protein